jgi:hypothetical protein
MKELGVILGVIGVLFLYALLLAFPTYFLWNWLMPDIFGLGRIDVIQALGLNFLANILFKSNVTINKKD